MANQSKRTRPEPVLAKVESEEEAAAELPAGAADLVEDPLPKTRKQAAKEAEEEARGTKKKVAGPKIVPIDDVIRNKKGEPRLDEDGDQAHYAPGFHKGVGYVNESGVRFPVGYTFPGGFVGTRGNVVLNKCPKCGYRQGIDEAMMGRCHANECGHNAVLELEAIEL